MKICMVVYPSYVLRLRQFVLDVFTIERSQDINHSPYVWSHLLEPIGSVPPKIAGHHLQDLLVKAGNDFAILCLGQSYPTPNFR